MVGCARPKDCHYVTINVKNQSQLRWQSIDARVIFQIFFININGRRWDEARIDLQFSLMLFIMKASAITVWDISTDEKSSSWGLCYLHSQIHTLCNRTIPIPIHTLVLLLVVEVYFSSKCHQISLWLFIDNCWHFVQFSELFHLR